MGWPARLSFNQFTATPRPLDEWLPDAVAAGVSAVGLNREQIEAYGVDRALRVIKDAGLPITIYSSLGYWASGRDPEGRARTQADDLRNLDEAVSLGTELVGVIGGGLAPGDRDLRGARRRIGEGLAQLLPEAIARGLRLAVEPLHPVFGPTRGVIHTLRHTLDILDELGRPPSLGVVLDTYHVWWEPGLAAQLERARDRIFLVQVNDWSPEMARSRGPFLNRALPGYGCIDFPTFERGLTGYTGWVEVEAPNDELSEMDAEGMFRILGETSVHAMPNLLAAAVVD